LGEAVFALAAVLAVAGMAAMWADKMAKSTPSIAVSRSHRIYAAALPARNPNAALLLNSRSFRAALAFGVAISRMDV
jgi:hypothetical protein